MLATPNPTAGSRKGPAPDPHLFPEYRLRDGRGPVALRQRMIHEDVHRARAHATPALAASWSHGTEPNFLTAVRPNRSKYWARCASRDHFPTKLR